MKYIFFGTPKFAAIVLEELINSGYVPEAVICNPDEPIGRKQILTSPPVKRLIADSKLPIEIFQPATKTELLAISHELSTIKPDLAIIAAYGKIIQKTILDIPKYGTLNTHASLLPAYRGASPIQYAILNGDKETGITIMKIDEEVDHGPIISKSECQISNNDTYESLSQKLAILGAKLLIKIIPDYISGKIKLAEQDHSKATYTKIIKKEDGKIDWSKSAQEIERMTRAFYPWPTAWTIWNDKILKIIEADIAGGSNNNHEIGKMFLINKKELSVKCGDGNLTIKKLQLEGGRILSAKEFLNGHKDFI